MKQLPRFLASAALSATFFLISRPSGAADPAQFDVTARDNHHFLQIIANLRSSLNRDEKLIKGMRPLTKSEREARRLIETLRMNPVMVQPLPGVVR